MTEIVRGSTNPVKLTAADLAARGVAATLAAGAHTRLYARNCPGCHQAIAEAESTAWAWQERWHLGCYAFTAAKRHAAQLARAPAARDDVRPGRGAGPAPAVTYGPGIDPYKLRAAAERMGLHDAARGRRWEQDQERAEREAARRAARAAREAAVAAEVETGVAANATEGDDHGSDGTA